MADRRKRKGDHVVMQGDGYTCLHCGDHQSITIPQLVESMVAMGLAWAKVHEKCQPRSTGGGET